MPENFRCELISLDDVYDLSWRLGQQILESEFNPEVVVAIARGGFVPARFLCDFLDLSAMNCVKVQHYLPGAEKEERAWIRYPLSGRVEGQRVLLVDDVNDTGDTLEVALDHVKSLGAEEVRTCVLHEKLTTKVPADFKQVIVRDWHWIIYPWAVVEDVSGFLNKMESLPGSVEEAAEYLQKQYNINLPEERLRMLLKRNRLYSRSG